MRRPAVSALLLTLVALVLAASVSASPQALLRLVSKQPLALQGRGFHPGESVRITVLTSVTVSRRLRADASGAFTVRFGISGVQCGGVFARARGSTGTLATLKVPLPACLAAARP